MKPSASVLAYVYIVAIQALDHIALSKGKDPYTGQKAPPNPSPAVVIFLALTFMSCGASAFSQTSIVVVRRQDQIVIAADSKRTVVGNGSLRACKIQQIGPFFFASAGFVGHPEFLPVGVPEIVEELREHPHPRLADLSQGFEVRIKPILQKFLERMARGQPDFYKQRLEKPGPLEAVFAGFENGVPKINALDFKSSLVGQNKVVLTVHRTDCPGSACIASEREFVLTLGHKDAINHLLDTPHITLFDDPAIYAEWLVTLEVNEAPEDVGLPIDVLKIDRSGATWIKEEPECPQIDESVFAGHD